MSILSKTQIAAIVDEWVVGHNAERDRKILKRRLIDGVTFERLAEDFGLSTRQAQNIVYRRMETLSKHM